MTTSDYVAKFTPCGFNLSHVKRDPRFKEMCKTRPVEAALRLRYAELIGVSPFMDAKLSDGEVIIRGTCDETKEAQAHELQSYLSPSSSSLEGDRFIEAFMHFAEWYLPNASLAEKFNLVKDIIKQSKRRAGRPVAKRQLAVRALDLKHTTKQHLSWAQLANRVCPCKKSKHDAGCRETLRQSVMALQRVLRKYNITVPCK
jgi:hypothetical protein